MVCWDGLAYGSTPGLSCLKVSISVVADCLAASSVVDMSKIQDQPINQDAYHLDRPKRCLLRLSSFPGPLPVLILQLL